MLRRVVFHSRTRHGHRSAAFIEPCTSVHTCTHFARNNCDKRYTPRYADHRSEHRKALSCESTATSTRLPRWTSRVRVPSPALKLATEAQASVAALLRAGDASRATPGPRAAPPPWVLRTRLRRVRVPKDFPYSRTEIKETPFARIARAIPGCARTHHPPRGAITHDRASYWTSTRTTDTPSRQDCTCQRERVSCPRCEFVPASFVSPPSA